MEVESIVPPPEDIDQGVAILAAIVTAISRGWRKANDLDRLAQGGARLGPGRSRRSGRVIRTLTAIGIISYVAFRVDIPSVDSEPTEPTRPVTLIVEDLFASGSEALSPVADTRLEDILDEVGTDRGGPRVEILGSCDDTNQPAACLEQAVVRARAVANWLADEGVPVRRLSVRGAGARQPIIDEHRRPEATDQQVELRLDPDPSDQQSPRD